MSNLTTVERIDSAILQSRPPKSQANALGFSICGDPDERTLWHEFRWSFEQKEITPEKARIFRMGETIETIIIKDLRLANFCVYSHDPEGNQFTYKLLGGHFVGKLDAVVMDLPEYEKGAFPLEIKSANQAEFNRFKKVGLRQWNEKYWAQTQAALAVTETQTALFICECKNTSRRHYEFIQFDQMFWFGCLAKMKRAISRKDCPPSCYKETDIQVARFMTKEKRRLYLGESVPKPNCRNCKYSEPVLDDSIDGQWLCHKKQQSITISEQRKGCEDHLFLQSLMPNGIEQTANSWDIHGLSLTNNITKEALNVIESTDIQHVIAVNQGKPAISVKCGDCQHFTPDSVGLGDGVGLCAFDESTNHNKVCRPKGVRDCKKFSKLKSTIEVYQCQLKSTIPVSVAAKLE